MVGIPSYNNARTIGHVVQAVQAGLAKYFPGAALDRANSDGGSSDGTPEVVQAAALATIRLLLIAHPLFPMHRLTFPYHGSRARAAPSAASFALRSCWRAGLRGGGFRPAQHHAGVDRIAARAGAGRTASTTWRRTTQRHKYDGTITNSIVYPLTRALYGQRVRQPIGGDFGFPAGWPRTTSRKPVWETDVARYGIDIWMTTTAICEGFSVCQSFLGAKIHDAKDPGADLSAMLVQVVGTVFRLMETYETVWHGSRGVPRYAAAWIPLRGRARPGRLMSSGW